jgi:hypothetical protein
MHFFPRYGLADLIAQSSDLSVEEGQVVSNEGPSAGAGGSEGGLGEDLEETLTEKASDLAAYYLGSELRVYGPPGEDTKGTSQKLSRVESETGQKSSGGYYTRPHAIADAGQSLNAVIGSPEAGKELKLGHCPFAQRMSSSAKAEYSQPGPLFTALSEVATYTPNKIAMRWPGTDDRLGLIPDLGLEDMVTFIRFYRTYVRPDVDLMSATVTGSGNWRLHCNSGTYPDPAPAWSFGALGLTAGMVRWAERLGYLERAEAILRAIGRVYVIGTATKYQRTERLENHVIRLAERGSLWQLLRDADRADPDRDPGSDGDEDELTEFRLFLRRWLASFDRHDFERFLSVRTQYPSSFHPALKEYFLMSYDEELIGAAKAAGNHISRKAYAATDGDTEEANKILDAIESQILESGDASEMVASLTTRVGRLTGSMFDPKATKFFDAILTREDLGLEEAQNLLMAYMRVLPEEDASGGGPSGEGDSDESSEGSGPDEGAKESASTEDAPNGNVSGGNASSGDASGGDNSGEAASGEATTEGPLKV